MRRKSRIDLGIVIPAYNEKTSLPSFIVELDRFRTCHPDYKIELIFVDDGSTDDTAAIISDLTLNLKDCHLVRLQQNSGMGSAVLEGFQRSVAEYITLLPADGQIAPTVLSEILPLLGNYDLILTTYSGQARSLLRQFTSRLFLSILRYYCHCPLNYQGIFVLRKSYFSTVQPRSRSFLAFFEFIETIRRRNPGILTVTIPIECRERTAGMSKVFTVKRIAHLAVELTKFARIMRSP